MTRSFVLPTIAMLGGCGGPSSSAPAAPVPSLDVPPLAVVASAAPPTRPAPPKLDATCTANADCEAVFTDDHCCHQCRPRIANEAWRRELDAFCAKDENHGACDDGPMGCSWGYSTPRCEKGMCK